MANSVATLSRRLCRSLLSNPKISYISMPFSTDVSSSSDQHSDSDESALPETDSFADSSPPPPQSSSSPQGSSEQLRTYDRPLQNGLDVGIYKAIIVGQTGQNPIQKKLRSGRKVTLLSVGTGGIRNNRRPLENEEPIEYANRCAVQWHRVSVYPERLGEVVMKHGVPGSIIYLEGNLETKIFTDPVTGFVRRIREIAIRRNGRIVFLGKGDAQQLTPSETRGVGYY